MPAYNAAKTLVQTFEEVMAQDIVDKVIVVDDASRDETTAIARTLPNTIVFTHEKNLGYGGNQKSCYRPGAGGRGGHRHHGASRFAVHPQTHSGHGLDDRQRTLSLRARQPHSGRLRLARRDAALEIRRQPRS